MNQIKQYLEESKELKRGITFYLKGNVVTGFVIRIDMEEGFVEVKNQTASKIMIFLDQIDALGLS